MLCGTTPAIFTFDCRLKVAKAMRFRNTSRKECIIFIYRMALGCVQQRGHFVEHNRITSQQQVPEPFVDAIQAAEFLSLRPRRVLELARQGAIPGHPLGSGERRVWRFRLSELASVLCAGEVNYPRLSPAPRQETK